MAQVLPQHQGRGHIGAVFTGQLFEPGRHRLGPRKQPQVPRDGGRAVVAQGHRHLGQGGQHGPHQPLLGGVESVELVDEHRPPLQKDGRAPFGQGRFQPGGGQLDPVGGVHAGLRQQRLVPLVDQGHLPQAAALGTAALGQAGKVLPGEAGAFQLVDGLGRQLAEGGAVPVPVVELDVVLQFLEGAADQRHPPRVGQGLDGRAPLLGQDALGQAGEGEALHKARALVPQLAVDAPLGGGGELFGHQQDAGFLLGRAPGQLGVKPAGLAAARPSQHQFEHSKTPSFFCIQTTQRPIAPPGPGMIQWACKTNSKGAFR